MLDGPGSSRKGAFSSPSSDARRFPRLLRACEAALAFVPDQVAAAAAAAAAAAGAAGKGSAGTQ